MKKTIGIITILLAIVLVFYFVRVGTTKDYKTETTRNRNISTETSDSTQIIDNYVGSLYKGNWVWAGAMSLAWNKLSQDIVGGPIEFEGNELDVTNIASAFNSSVFSSDDLREENYYARSGFGQKTVETINREMKKKFPSKSFEKIKINLGERGIIAYAYLKNEVEYKEAFLEADIEFLGEKVPGFEASETQRENIRIVNYSDDDEFIISLDLKNDQDEIFLAKGYESGLKAVLDTINQSPDRLPRATQVDRFKAPIIDLESYRRDYTELINKSLSIKGNVYEVAQMYENITFKMDEKGAKVENEAVMAFIPTATNRPQKIERKNLILNKPYWVIMKQSNSLNPYFILRVSNTNLMK